MEIAEFLLARIAEDEAAARAATAGPWEPRLYWFGFDDRPGNSWASIPDVISEEIDATDAAHIARHDPARVLAECEAKRRIVEFYGGPVGTMYVLQFLAQPYAEHPDFDPAWKV